MYSSIMIHYSKNDYLAVYFGLPRGLGRSTSNRIDFDILEDPGSGLDEDVRMMQSEAHSLYIHISPSSNPAFTFNFSAPGSSNPNPRLAFETTNETHIYVEKIINQLNSLVNGGLASHRLDVINACLRVKRIFWLRSMSKFHTFGQTGLRTPSAFHILLFLIS
jgi:hypothetical protein